MGQIPRDESFDSTLALLSEGYRFISNRCNRYETDIFETRLMLNQAICAVGEDAAKMFYHPDRFTRKEALPPTALILLQDKGSVQVMDGGAHHHRKEMFMSLMSRGNIQHLANIMASEWRESLKKWEHQDKVVLQYEAEAILCRAVCQWAGISLSENEVEKRTREFAAMVDGAGAVGPRSWKGILLRMRTEQWARDIITEVRSQKRKVPEESAVHVVARHQDQQGELLEKKVAAVELINLLRPTVAVARYITFVALALHEYPEFRQKLQSATDDYHELFVQEVRRFYPFFPVIAGRVLNEFYWRDYHFAKGTWVLLDIYGTNHDKRIWEKPEVFWPERHLRQDENSFALIPQGGGDHYHGHRCAGEWITIELMKAGLDLLTMSMRYNVPEQDFKIDLSRMPAVPESGFVINKVQRV